MIRLRVGLLLIATAARLAHLGAALAGFEPPRPGDHAAFLAWRATHLRSADDRARWG